MIQEPILINVNDNNEFNLERFSNELRDKNITFKSSALMNSKHLIFSINLDESELDNLLELLIPISLCWTDHKCGIVALCSSEKNVKSKLSDLQGLGKYLIFDTTEEATRMLSKYSALN